MLNRKLLLFVPTIALLSLLPLQSPIVSEVCACPCEQKMRNEEITESSAIFEGVVTSIETKTDTKQTESVKGQKKRVNFHVVRSWKGVTDEEITVLTPLTPESCGFEFRKDESYLVFAVSESSHLYVSSCSRTKPVEDASKDIRLLGIGEVPVHVKLTDQEKKVYNLPKKPPAKPAGCASCEMMGGKRRINGLPVFLLSMIVFISFMRKTNTD